MKINEKIYTLIGGLLMTTILLSPSISEAKDNKVKTDSQKYYTLADTPEIKNYNRFDMKREDTPYQTNNKKSDWSYEEWRFVLHNHIKPTVIEMMKTKV